MKCLLRNPEFKLTAHFSGAHVVLIFVIQSLIVCFGIQTFCKVLEIWKWVGLVGFCFGGTSVLAWVTDRERWVQCMLGHVVMVEHTTN